jgi:hypothetical protein
MSSSGRTASRLRIKLRCLKRKEEFVLAAERTTPVMFGVGITTTITKLKRAVACYVAHAT